MRISIRFKIFFLIMVFVMLLTGVFFKLSYNFFIEDKTNTVQEIQTLQISKASNDIAARVSSARGLLKEAALMLLDPSRGQVKQLSSRLLYVAVEKKSWAADSFKASQIEPTAPSDGSSWSLEAFKVDGKPYFRIRDQLLIRRSQKDEQLPMVGVFAADHIVGQAALAQGFTEAVLVDLKKLREGGGSAEAYLISEASPEVNELKSILDNNAGEWKDRLVNSKQPVSMLEKNIVGDPLALVSWTPILAEEGVIELLVLSHVSYSKIEAGFRDFVVQLLVIAFLVAGLSAFAAFAVARHLSRPIEQVVEATQVLETGDFSVRVDARTSDEIGDLGRAFNHLGQALHDREMQLNAAQSALIQNEKLAALGTLSAGIAHEVKNPLAGILGNAELAEVALSSLGQSGPSAKIGNYISVIKKETQRTKGIIDGLMRFSRKEKQEHEPFDLEVVLHETIALMEHSLNMNGVTIRTNFDPELMQVKGHANSVEQVFLNMLQNAGHAMPDGGEIEISTKYYADGEAPNGGFMATSPKGFTGPFCRVQIRDTGSGMTREIMGKIFEPFFTTKGAGVGTGLGLSVTMSILNDHKSRVSIDSEPGVGTSFYLDFLAVEPRTTAIRDRIREVVSRKHGGAGDYQPQKASGELSAPHEPAAVVSNTIVDTLDSSQVHTNRVEAKAVSAASGLFEVGSPGRQSKSTGEKMKIQGTQFSIRKPGGKA